MNKQEGEHYNQGVKEYCIKLFRLWQKEKRLIVKLPGAFNEINKQD